MFLFFNNDEFQNFNNYDLDFFIKDELKLIHISTAGMNLDSALLKKINSIGANLKTVLAYRRKFKVKMNDEIQRDNLYDLESYVYFFKLMASKGFYSYDKYDINNPEDKRIQLISSPIYDRNILVVNIEFIKLNEKSRNLDYSIDFIKARKNFPKKTLFRSIYLNIYKLNSVAQLLLAMKKFSILLAVKMFSAIC